MAEKRRTAMSIMTGISSWRWVNLDSLGPALKVTDVPVWEALLLVYVKSF